MSGEKKPESELHPSSKRSSASQDRASWVSTPSFDSFSEGSTVTDMHTCALDLRGDVQPFIALGIELMRYGHRVRIATHNVFEDFVQDSGLEFYPIGGNSAELMAYMVRNPGIIPQMETLRSGEIKKKRLMNEQMLEGCWSSCLEPDPRTGNPFVADAVIANPPSFAHIHCAQALGIPVHLMFTMPWSNTRHFPHPPANLKNAADDRSRKNYASYTIVNWLTWNGDVVNRWRKTLRLEDIPTFDGHALAGKLNIPFTYCWSPALVPKPTDWPSHIDVCGFFFRESPKYDPPEQISRFMEKGPPPVYIGFGSIVLDEPQRITAAILEAVNTLGIRAIISRGWSDLGGNVDTEGNGNVLFVGDCPHEWLFSKVAAVVHHGGAGTTACGLKNARPTLVVPFFGDQPFWGQMIASAGAGPKPIPHQDLTASTLTRAIKYCLSTEAATAALEISKRMESETGIETAAQSFHRNLPVENSACQIFPHLTATWRFKENQRHIHLSSLAAAIIISKSGDYAKSLKLYKPKPIVIEPIRWDPISGGASTLLGTAMDLSSSFTGIFTKPVTEYRHDRDRRTYDEEFVKAQSEATAGKSMGPSGLEADDAQSTILTSSTGSRRKGMSAARLVGASAKSIGGFAPTALKAVTADIPLALTEGLRSLPAHFGDKPRDNGKVTNWSSGMAVAGKSFAWGFADGLSDFVVKPYQGGREEGIKGVGKGIGKGVVGLVSKSGAGMFGLLAYSSAGIAKSIRMITHTGTDKKIAEARLVEGEWLLRNSGLSAAEIQSHIATFEALRKGH
ncbi:Sterol 3-beta-glucosyltransferase [Elsinoe australis]|uniref:Sterol 3-beta-glucosyltransferase n=1 Tax=Elsinoe australis TaxID=40998 RepID=A0A2P8A1H8_9PEZI|nr:Sterol 3-beta-glucosyltransferase [Elsinoe australis]